MLAAGGGGAVVSFVVALAASVAWTRSGRARPAPVAGAGVVAGMAIALALAAPAGDAAWRVGAAGVVLLAAGYDDDIRGRAAGATLPLAVVALLFLVPREPRWLFVVLVVGALVGGGAVAVADRRWGSTGVPLVLVVMSVAGAYATLPETRPVVLLLWVLAPLMLLALPAGGVARVRIGTGGAFAVAGILAWVAHAGGVFRPSSAIGAMACLGLLVAEPAARLAAGGRQGAFAGLPRLSAAVLALAGHAAVVLVAARVAGLRQDAGAAAAIAAAVLLLATTVLLLVDVGTSRRAPEPPPDE